MLRGASPAGILDGSVKPLARNLMHRFAAGTLLRKEGMICCILSIDNKDFPRRLVCRGRCS